MNRELPDVRAGFRKGRGTRDQIANIRWIIEKAREFQKNIKNLEVGAQVKVVGRVQSRNYEKKYEDGTVQNRVAYEVSIGSLELIEEDNNEQEESTENVEAV